ncbi:MAG: tetratricopeptide repeat protein, partial [Deltaproteobacteria bacterium]|nr:tetratricopeptide repeat protein [Deltaproteobacteria bacterium]
WIFANLKVPATDPFSYTFGGRPWVDFTWGFQALVHLFYAYLGQWTGLFILQSVVVGLTFLFLYLSLRLATNRPWLAVAVLFLSFGGAHSRFFIRPHIFEYFFVSLYLMLFTLHEKKGRRHFLYLLLPLQVLWVNIHSSAILGVFIACAYFGGQIIDEFRQGGWRLRMDLSAKAKSYLLAAVALPVVSLLNPYGLRLVIFPFRHNSPDNADAIRHIGEWVRPQLKELFFYFYPFPLDHFAFALIILFLAAALALNIRRVRAREPMLLAAGLYMALSHVRWIPLFFFFAAPVLAAWIASYLDSRREEPRALRLGATLLSLFFAAIMLWDYLGPAKAGDRGLGLKPGSYPVGTVEFMRREGITGNIYNTYVYGGYLIFNYPEVKVFIDGRTPTVYSPYFFWQSRVSNEPKRWKRLTEEYGIDIALVKLKDAHCEKLHENKEWKAVSFDDTSILYLKQTERFKGVISRRGFSLNACVDDFKKLPEDEGKLNEIRAELSRALEDDIAARSSRAHKLLGFVDAKLGRHEDAVVELKKALSISPDAETYYTLGAMFGKLGKKEEALNAFKASIKRNKKHADGWLGAGVAYYDMKDYRNAISALEKHVVLADDSSEQLAYKTLAKAYFETGRPGPAAVYFKRAAFITDDKDELADIYYSLGNALFETGDFTQGARYYSLAVENKPDYAAVLKELARTHRVAGRKDKAEGILALFGERVDGAVERTGLVK